jgi:G:T-mismatch repair DNA endonuclease (very short patch repair protein)
MYGKVLKIRFNDPNDSNITRWVDECLGELVSTITESMDPEDRVGLEFSSLRFPEKPFYVSFRYVNQLSKDVILEKLNKIIQSNESFFLNDTFNVFISHVINTVAAGQSRACENITYSDWLKRHNSSIVNIKTKDGDNLCFALAVMVGKICRDIGLDTPEWKRFKTNVNKNEGKEMSGMLFDEYNRFWVPLNIDVSNGATIESMKKTQEAVKDNFRFIIFSDRSGKSLLYTPDEPANSSVVDIYMHYENNHIIFIRPDKLQAVFGYNYYCVHCRTGFSRKFDHHKCEYRCSRCYRNSRCTGDDVKCNDCNRFFFGDDCLAIHKADNICKSIRMCENCSLITRRNITHECFKVFCGTCLCRREIPHKCFIPCLKEDKDVKKTEKVLYVYYDFESRQEDEIEGHVGRFRHSPNLCVAFQKCFRCPSITRIEEINDNCSHCGIRKHIFQKDTTVVDFVDYLIKIDEKKFNEIIVIAHNAKSYDAHFVLREILENRSPEPSIILNGAQIFAIHFKRLRFIDSLNFFNCALSKLPAMWGIGNLKKGYYPHLFNTRANEDAPPQSLPDKKFFIPESMSQSDRQKFDEWHDELSGQNFIFENFKEMVGYCENDVFILMQACSSFQKLFKEYTGLDIFRKAITIASACNKVFRTKFLKKDTIPIIPRNGYRMRNNQSKVALKWLYWLTRNRADGLPKMIHAGTGLEKRVLGKYYVDGYDPVDQKVYEMLGCYWHQCPRCFGSRPLSKTDLINDNVPLDSNMAIRYEETMTRLKNISVNHSVEVIWECDFRKNIASTPEFKAWEKDNAHLWEVPKLDPRDSFMGGRVSNLKLYKEIDVNKNEKNLYDAIQLPGTT